MKKCQLFVAAGLLLSSGLAFAAHSTTCANFKIVNDSMWSCAEDQKTGQISNCHKVPQEIAYIYQSGSVEKQYILQPGVMDNSVPQVIGDTYWLSGPDGNAKVFMSIFGCSSGTIYVIRDSSNGNIFNFANQDPSQQS